MGFTSPTKPWFLRGCLILDAINQECCNSCKNDVTENNGRPFSIYPTFKNSGRTVATGWSIHGFIQPKMVIFHQRELWLHQQKPQLTQSNITEIGSKCRGTQDLPSLFRDFRDHHGSSWIIPEYDIVLHQQVASYVWQKNMPRNLSSRVPATFWYWT